ncbi:class II glutamine amidotransferase [Paraburkholderia saeva]|uniref:Glutamine amidotransferase YafJ n=1 Tax=Paraburkholderia saeva TaxID=2777537 RepID=A0A9N8RRA0_9BURK|nr:class II glutamine amidotransferase [Paraburkholderia saeva]CAG4886082.1 Putative glutamine amidotransferase YafJ [Paraburkholderia saeva]CAG4887470.1 Putative glutamine amidotransferase YafJ [Paraburkholderia saeva]CAG4915589.1 Putative glutamine amidotransferase YafJ [Paraburkholderia saeva]
MCQLLGMNCAAPTDVTFSFTGFAARGGVTDHHADGWGIAFFEDKACRLFIDHQSSATSPIAEMVKRYPIKSKNTIAHIRKATQGHIQLENCHPFMRELWGRHWIFAHNGDLQDYNPFLTGVYQPVGTTDSELAFCALLQGLRKEFPGSQPGLDELFAALEKLTREITQAGVFNFLMSNGQALFAHCSTRLYYLVRRWPFSTAHLVDADVSIDFAKYTTPEDRVAVIATQPLTDNEVWTAFEPGDLLMFQHGEVVARTNVPVPPVVLEKLRNPASDPSASVPMPVAHEQTAETLDLESDDAAAFES